MFKAILASSAVFTLISCAPSDDVTTTETAVTTTSETEPVGFAITGTAVSLITGAIAQEGLCIHASDPTAAITGGEIEILASGVIGSDGTFLVENVSTTSLLGILMLVEDCDQTGDEMPTATGIAAATYSGLGEGDEIEMTSYTIDADTLVALSGQLTASGFTGDITEDGALIGFVRDQSGQPVAGATITGHADYPTYYSTVDTFDGTATTTEANALFAIPAAPIFTYECSSDAHTFDSKLAGSQAGYAVVVSFNAL